MADAPKAHALMTLRASGGPPSLAEAARRLAVEPADLDAVFGVVTVDPDQGLYAVQVRADKLPGGAAPGGDYSGPWSNPPIAPFGPPEPGEGS